MSKALSPRSHWLAASSVKGLGFRTLSRVKFFLQTTRHDWAEWWQSPTLQKESGLHLLQQQAVKEWLQYWQPGNFLAWIEEQQLVMISCADETFPAPLRELDHRPAALFIKGQLPTLHLQKLVAVVGTRRATLYGQTVTRELTERLVAAGCGIVSGFMYGIDQIAHHAAVAVGGQTIAVLGFGHHHQLVPSSQRLWHSILEAQGVIISEYPPWYPPQRGTFLARNRIVAGLAAVTVVTEAPWQSGSYVTASLAAEYGREVCAVPGPVTSPASDGTWRLGNEGAHLVRNGDDVLAVMSWNQLGHNREINSEKTGSALERLLSTQPLTSEEIVAASQQPLGRVLAELGQLVSEGKVITDGSRWFTARRGVA